MQHLSSGPNGAVLAIDISILCLQLSALPVWRERRQAEQRGEHLMMVALDSDAAVVLLILTTWHGSR